MGVKFSNLARSTLAVAINATDTTLRVAVGTGARFPTLKAADDWFPVAVADTSGKIEIMRGVARMGDAITVRRGQEGTAAVSFALGSAVYLPQTAAALAELTGAADLPSVSVADGVLA